MLQQLGNTIKLRPLHGKPLLFSGDLCCSYPRRKVIFRKKVMPLGGLHISNVSLKSARSQLEEQRLLMAALRPQHLLPQLSIIEVAHLAASGMTKY